MTRHDPMSETLRREASEWYALSLSDSLSDGERQALTDWLGADASHADAFRRMDRARVAVGRIASLADLVPLSEPPSAPRRPLWAAMRARPARWGTAAAAMAASLLAVAWVGLPTSGPLQTEATELAQTRSISLGDGTRITLGPQTRLSTAIDSDRRIVSLASGEAFFEVAHDPTRPFVVEAGEARIEVMGTRFNVHRVNGRVEVSVLDGVVRVRQPAPLLASAPVQVLHARQRLETVDQATAWIGEAPAPAPVSADPVPAGDWRNGRLTYVDARLGDVVEDLNRYYRPGLRLADPALADQRIAASLRPSELDAFLEGFPLIAPVRVRRQPDGSVIIERAPS